MLLWCVCAATTANKLTKLCSAVRYLVPWCLCGGDALQCVSQATNHCVTQPCCGTETGAEDAANHVWTLLLLLLLLLLIRVVVAIIAAAASSGAAVFAARLSSPQHSRMCPAWS